MLAVDTNVLVRFLTADDVDQAPRALAIFRDQVVWVAKTVLLETEWVLRSLYGFEAPRVAVALAGVVGLPSVRVEDPVAIRQALDWSTSGLDFADALHLASRDRAEALVTFDEGFRRRASRFTNVAARTP